MGLFKSKEEKGLALYTEGVECYNTKNYNRAFLRFRSASLEGHIQAQFECAGMYLKGIGTKKKPYMAKSWYEKAAEKGHAGAQAELALLYYNGKEIKQDYAKAFDWFQKSAAQGNDMAQYGLALMYLNGEGTIKNLEMATEFARRAATQSTDEFKKDAEELLAEIRKAQGGTAEKTETPPVKTVVSEDEAMKPAENAVNVTPEATAGAGLSVEKGRELYNAGMEHYRAGRLVQALSCFDEASKHGNAEAIGILQGNPVVDTASMDTNVERMTEAAEPIQDSTPQVSSSPEFTETAADVVNTTEDGKETPENANEAEEQITTDTEMTKEKTEQAKEISETITLPEEAELYKKALEFYKQGQHTEALELFTKSAECYRSR